MVSSGMLHRVALVRTDVSEELSASFIRVTRIGELGTTLAVTSNRCTLRRNTWYFLVFISSAEVSHSCLPCTHVLILESPVYPWKCLSCRYLVTTNVFILRFPNNDGIRPNTSQYCFGFCFPLQPLMRCSLNSSKTELFVHSHTNDNLLIRAPRPLQTRPKFKQQSSAPASPFYAAPILPSPPSGVLFHPHLGLEIRSEDQNYWGSAHCLLSRILNTRKQNVSESECLTDTEAGSQDMGIS
jgi:hypothetical protein